MTSPKFPPAPLSRTAAGVSVAVTSDQSLIAEAVRTALASHGCAAFVVPWTVPVATVEVRPGGPCPDAVLLMSDLASSAAVLQATSAAARWASSRSVLLTGAPAGPLWGAVLAGGIDVVMPLSTTLEELLPVVQDLSAGAPVMDERLRVGLVRRWRAATEERRALVARVDSLSRRERTVLRLLHAGEPVDSIAELLAVSPSTVRSQVRAVLRKLGVRSQLAAVAQFDLVQQQFPWEDVPGTQP